MSQLSLPRHHVLCRILTKTRPAPHHVEFILHAPTIAHNAQPGQFIHVLGRPSRSFDPLLRRAFSLKDVEGETITMLFRIEGRATQWLSELQVEDNLDVIGPLGSGFNILSFDEFSANVSQETMQSSQEHPSTLLVGGGVGIPPLLFLARRLKEKDLSVGAILGAQTSHQILGERELKRWGIEPHLATDDGTAGKKGRVTDILSDILKRNLAPSMVYSCGPWPMLKAVALICRKHEIRCQVSLEESMPCGIGVCNGCVVRSVFQSPNETTPGHPRSPFPSAYDEYRRICVDGPVMWAHEVEWGHDE